MRDRRRLASLLVVLPILAGAALALRPAPQEPRAVPAAGAVPGAARGDRHFSAEWHAGRRKALVEETRRRVGTPAEGEAERKAGTIVLRGAPARRDYQKFRQTNEFFYLTGAEAPGAALVIDVASGDEILFLAPMGMGEGVWTDLMPHAPRKATAAPEEGSGGRRRNRGGDPELQAESEAMALALGFADLRDASELSNVLEARADQGPFWTMLAPEEYESTSRDEAITYERHQESDALDGRPSRTKQLGIQLTKQFGAEVKDLTQVLDRLRRIKTPEEIEAIRNASRIAAAGHIAAMRATRPGLKEWQIGAEATAVFERMGSPWIAYFPIVGTGRNAIILHYTGCGATVAEDDVILMDYAPEWRFYASDVTRSWPASGKFSARGREIYQAVLDAQLAAIAAVKPGVPFSTVNAAAAQALAKAGFPPQRYMPHGLSHAIGLSTHDVGGIGTLEPGLVFTIEPGVYDRESGIGVRIEDVIAVTADGHDNLSKDAPKTIAEIEAIVGKPAR